MNINYLYTIRKYITDMTGWGVLVELKGGNSDKPINLSFEEEIE